MMKAKLFAAMFALATLSLGEAAHAQVAFDAKGTASCNINAATGNCTTLTVGSGSNRVLVVYVTYAAAAAFSVLTATWNGTNVPIVTSQFSSAKFVGTALMCLAAPASGNQTLAMSITATSRTDLHVIGASFTGANQTTPCKNGTTTTDQVATTASITVTSATGDIPVAVFGQGDNSITSMNGTTVVIDNSGPNISIGANYGTGAATVAMTATALSSTWQMTGADIAAASGGAAVIPGPLMPGPVMGVY